MQYGNSRILIANPTVTAAAYSAGHSVGGLLDFSNLGSVNKMGVLKTVTVVDGGNQKAALTLLLFREKPAATFTDRAANGLTIADLKLVTAKINIATADYETVNSLAIATIDTSHVVRADGTRNKLYGLLVTTGTPTYTATTNIQVLLGILAD